MFKLLNSPTKEQHKVTLSIEEVNAISEAIQTQQVKILANGGSTTDENFSLLDSIETKLDRAVLGSSHRG